MREVDYIIVGLGLGGIAFAEYCEQHQKKCIVFDQGGAGASRVAAGLYNPVILKRYSLPWKSVEQFDLALTFYERLGHKLQIEIKKALPVRKVFSSIEDQNNWFAASDGPTLGRFVQTPIVQNDNEYVKAPYHFGEVAETGKIDIKKLQKSYEAHLSKSDSFINESFDYEQVIFGKDDILYKGIKAQKIICAEGYGIKENPYFKNLPLVGNKGEYLIIKAPQLQLNAALKGNFFVVPLGDDLYKIGATFNWTDKDSVPSQEAREELVAKLSNLLTVPYEIVDQEAGIRPTTGDRRALLGVHPKFPQLVLLNGLGTRGTMAGPLLARYLFNHLEDGTPLPEEIDIMRFPKKFQ